MELLTIVVQLAQLCLDWFVLFHWYFHVLVGYSTVAINYVVDLEQNKQVGYWLYTVMANHEVEGFPCTYPIDWNFTLFVCACLQEIGKPKCVSELFETFPIVQVMWCSNNVATLCHIEASYPIYPCLGIITVRSESIHTRWRFTHFVVLLLEFETD
jgi:hypothetical protein